MLHARTGLFYSPIASSLSLETVRLDGQRQRSLTVYSPDFSNPFGCSGEYAAHREGSAGLRPESTSLRLRSLSSASSTRFFKNWVSQRQRLLHRIVGCAAILQCQRSPALGSLQRPCCSSPPRWHPTSTFSNTGKRDGFAGPYAFLGLNHFTQRFSLISGYLL